MNAKERDLVAQLIREAGDYGVETTYYEKELAKTDKKITAVIAAWKEGDDNDQIEAEVISRIEAEMGSSWVVTTTGRERWAELWKEVAGSKG
jgi:hypothetical protein